MNGTKFPSFLPSMEDSDSLRSFENFNQNVFTYVDPVALTLGVICNLLLCLVFLATPLKARPWSHVQIGIAMVDLIYVISCIVIHFFKKGEPVYDLPGMCQVTTFAVMVSRALQCWFVFIAHFDRLHSHFVHCGETRKRRVYNTKFALIIVALLILAPSVHVLWSYEVCTINGKAYCVPMRDDMQFHIIMRKIHMVGSVIIPLTLTVGIDLFFILKLSLHCFCSVTEDDDEGSQFDDLSVYRGYKINNDSSFCTDNVVESTSKKADLCEHLLDNDNVETSRANQFNHHHHQQHLHRNLSVIQENSLENAPNSGGGQNHIIIISEKALKNNSNSPHVDNRDKRVIDTEYSIKKKYSYDPNAEVARYILTTSTTTTMPQSKTNQNDIKDVKMDFFENKIEKDNIQQQDNTVTTNSAVEKGRYAKVDNSSRTLRQSGGKQSKRDKSVFNSNYKHSYTQNSVSYSQYHSYNYTSMASNVTRTTVVPEDHLFSDDVTSSSLTTVLTGIILCALMIPSAFVEGKTLFFSPVPFTRPSLLSRQEAIFFESLVLFNSVYKIILCIVILKSFRQAFVWLFSSCFSNRFSSSSSFCTISSDGNRKDNNNTLV